MRALMLIVVLAGCDRWRAGECAGDAEWSVPVHRPGGIKEGAEAFGSLGGDGVTWLAIADFTFVELGDTTVSGTTLARIDAIGNVIGIEPIDGGSQARVIAIDADEAGNLGLVTTTDNQTAVLRSFGTGFEVRWSQPIAPSFETPIAAASGEIAVADGSALRLFDNLGDTKWARGFPNDFIRAVGFADNGDVFAYGARAGRYAAADGSIIEEHVVQQNVSLIDRDGAGYEATFDDDGKGLVRKLALDGTVAWMASVGGRGVGSLSIATTGELLALVAGEIQNNFQRIDVVRLDRETGSERTRNDVCSFGRVVGGDAEGYVILGPIGSTSPGLARFQD